MVAMLSFSVSKRSSRHTPRGSTPRGRARVMPSAARAQRETRSEEVEPMPTQDGDVAAAGAGGEERGSSGLGHGARARANDGGDDGRVGRASEAREGARPSRRGRVDEGRAASPLSTARRPPRRVRDDASRWRQRGAVAGAAGRRRGRAGRSCARSCRVQNATTTSAGRQLERPHVGARPPSNLVARARRRKTLAATSTPLPPPCARACASRACAKRRARTSARRDRRRAPPRRRRAPRRAAAALEPSPSLRPSRVVEGARIDAGRASPSPSAARTSATGCGSGAMRRRPRSDRPRATIAGAPSSTAYAPGEHELARRAHLHDAAPSSSASRARVRAGPGAPR